MHPQTLHSPRMYHKSLESLSNVHRDPHFETHQTDTSVEPLNEIRLQLKFILYNQWSNNARGGIIEVWSYII